jgi:hypothetical protein
MSTEVFANNQPSINKGFILAVISCLIYFLIISDFWQSVGFGYFIFIFSLYLKNLDFDIPIRETILLLATFQWVVGPIVEYQNSFQSHKYYMYISSNEYFEYVIPGILFLHIGLFTFKTQFNKKKFLEYVNRINQSEPRLGLLLVVIGIASEIASPYVPISLNFVIYLSIQLKYVGVGFMIFSKHNNNQFIIVIVMLSLIYSSISSGFFHEMLIWGILLFPFFRFRYNLSNLKIIMISIAGLLTVLIIQSVKPILRLELSKNKQRSAIDIFTKTFSQQYAFGKLFDLNNTSQSNIRFNQGWIISAIIANVPKKTDYANGETISTGIYSAVVPRFLDSEKKQAGGREDFMKYTGLYLSEGTSMGMSLIGEGYANFGKLGIVFMFLYGLTISYIWRITTNPNLKWGNLALFLPIIFLQVIKAETDFVTVFTHLIKASVFVFVTLTLIRGAFNINLK